MCGSGLRRVPAQPAETVCEQARLDLPATPRSAGDARRFVAAQCDRWGLPLLVEDGVLAVSELVANAVVHGRSAVRLTLSLTGDVVEVAVGDENPRPPVVRPVRLSLDEDIDQAVALSRDQLDEPGAQWLIGEAGSITAGRGMLIVDAIADEWGISSRAVGKDVWFRLRTPTGADRVCRCPGSAATTPGGLPLRV